MRLKFPRLFASSSGNTVNLIVSHSVLYVWMPTFFLIRFVSFNTDHTSSCSHQLEGPRPFFPLASVTVFAVSPLHCQLSVPKVPSSVVGRQERAHSIFTCSACKWQHIDSASLFSVDSVLLRGADRLWVCVCRLLQSPEGFADRC